VTDGQFSITVCDGDPRVVKLRGDLDMATAPELRACLSESSGNVEVDCAGLDFIDSSGLGVFVDAHRALEARGMRLVIRNVPPRCRTVFDVTALDEVLHLE